MEGERMSAGDRDQRITIQVLSTTTNSYGEEVESWTDDQDRWARAEVTSGREFREHESEYTQERVTFYVERDTTVDAGGDYRVMWNGQAWNVVSAPDPRRRNERMIHCSRVVG
jgi:SPP1 family predicted phage head-tail adaptor